MVVIVDVTPESARTLADHAVATAATLSAAMTTAVRNSVKIQGSAHLPPGTRSATITALVERGVAGLGTRVGGRYVHFLTDHGNLVREVLIKGADAVLFEATNPMPAAPVMLFLSPGQEEPHDDSTFTAETRACAGALTDSQAQALLECSIGDDGAYHYLTTTDESVAAELVALGLAAPKHHAGVYAGVHPLTAKGSKVHDYLAIAPLLPSILPGGTHDDG